tara:strand:+ start:168 stop:686 length:519 start_codon:yes stop_codon:yes gene_type:complete
MSDINMNNDVILHKLDEAVYWSAISEQELYDIPDGLILAIIMTESTGEECAIRYEPDFRWLDEDALDHPPVRSTKPTEREGQSTSWGPMQVMGATARWMGFDGWFPELCGPSGVEYGVKYLLRQRNRYHNWPEAVAAYNAGSLRFKGDGRIFQNQQYVDKVYKALKDKSWLK